MDPFGYINPTYLVGITSLCNNPFFEGAGQPQLVDVYAAWRTSFGNHAFVTLAGKVDDATGGPYLGTDTEAQYINNAIDKSTPAEAASAGDVGDISDGNVTGIE